MGVLRWWPRRASGLPPGQRELSVLPRFSDSPLRPPPTTGPLELRVNAEGHQDLVLTAADLEGLGPSEQRSDLHCVTTWSHRRIPWRGVPFDHLWHERIAPWLGGEAFEYACAAGADRYRATFRTEDLLGTGVILATSIGDEPLGARHGAPLRLVSPRQYGYKSVKHLMSVELLRVCPPSRLGPKEHLRARVELEERHSRLPGQLLRWPYRVLVPLTAWLAERSLAAQPAAVDALPADGPAVDGPGAVDGQVEVDGSVPPAPRGP